VLGILSEIAYPGIQRVAWAENCSYLLHLGSLTYHPLKQIRYDHCYASRTIPFLPVCPFVRFLSLAVHSHWRTFGSEIRKRVFATYRYRASRRSIHDRSRTRPPLAIFLAGTLVHSVLRSLFFCGTLQKRRYESRLGVDHDSPFPFWRSFRWSMFWKFVYYTPAGIGSADRYWRSRNQLCLLVSARGRLQIVRKRVRCSSRTRRVPTTSATATTPCLKPEPARSRQIASTSSKVQRESFGDRLAKITVESRR